MFILFFKFQFSKVFSVYLMCVNLNTPVAIGCQLVFKPMEALR